jgi:molecular chaperone GrpE
VDHKQRKEHTISGLESQSDEASSPESSSAESQSNSNSNDKGGPSQDDPAGALAQKTDECQALQEKYLRLAAEFENYKRIAQRDQREYSRFANEQVLKELLPVVDNLERAIQSAKTSSETNTVIEGVQLTLKQFLETLSKFGVRPITSVGQPFDPSRHQAVTRTDDPDAPENTVVEEFQKGYLLHERVLRPAMVTVATGQRNTAQPHPPRPRGNGSDQTSTEEDDRYES